MAKRALKLAVEDKPNTTLSSEHISAPFGVLTFGCAVGCNLNACTLVDHIENPLILKPSQALIVNMVVLTKLLLEQFQLSLMPPNEGVAGRDESLEEYLW